MPTTYFHKDQCNVITLSGKSGTMKCYPQNRFVELKMELVGSFPCIMYIFNHSDEEEHKPRFQYDSSHL